MRNKVHLCHLSLDTAQSRYPSLNIDTFLLFGLWLTYWQGNSLYFISLHYVDSKVPLEYLASVHLTGSFVMPDWSVAFWSELTKCQNTAGQQSPHQAELWSYRTYAATCLDIWFWISVSQTTLNLKKQCDGLAGSGLSQYTWGRGRRSLQAECSLSLGNPFLSDVT